LTTLMPCRTMIQHTSMPVTTSQQIAYYYDQFYTLDVTFTPEVIRATNLFPKQVYLKCRGRHWPCVLYSTSMTGAKVIVNMNDTLKAVLRKAKNLVSLRFSFHQRDKTDPLAFFVSSRVSNITEYNTGSKELSFLTLSYTQRPPDDLIEVLGLLLDANINAKRRKEERIVITTDSLRKLGLKAKNTFAVVEGVPRKCIIRDLSFGGAKLIIVGLAKFLLQKKVTLRIDVEDQDTPVEVSGTVIRFEPVEGREDISAFAVQYDEHTIPVEYKVRINSYLKSYGRTYLHQKQQEQPEQAQE